MNAMRAELSILCALSKVTSSRLRDWIMERGRENRSRPRPQQDNRPARPVRPAQPVEKQPQSFDDMLKQFMADSDSKISGLKQYDRKTKTRRR